VNVFGVTHDTVRRHHFPGIQSFSLGSAPTSTTVTEKIGSAAADLAGKLTLKGIDAATIIDTASAAYAWCAETLRIATAVKLLQIISGVDADLAKAWKSELKDRYELLAEQGVDAMGGGASTTDLGGPDGPNTHISELSLDTGDDGLASDVIPPFRKDDQL
jgi:hypothetical protein